MTPVRLPVSLLAAALAAVFPSTAVAQAPPTSGELLQQLPPPPEREDAAPEVTIEPAAPAVDDATPFHVRHIAIEGNTVFDDAALHALVAEGEGRTQTLAGLNGLAKRITDHYRAHGHPLARAIIPAQALDGGTVRIQVVEARFDEVHVDNRSRVGDSLLAATVAPMERGELVTQASLDRGLLLLGELPGIRAHATLRPGATVGTSTLAVQVDPVPAVTGQVSLDNAGNRYTGRVRLGAWLQVANPLRHGDQLDVAAMTSGSDLSYGRVGYQATLNGRGTRLGAAYSTLDYALGGSLEALRAHGTANVASAWISHPLILRRDASLEVRLQADRKRLRDAIDVASLHGDRHATAWTLGVDGERRDRTGTTRGSLSVTQGDLAFDDAAAEAVDAASARTAGDYTRWNARIERLQVLGQRTRLLLAASGQASSDNLDSSEQFLLGGPYSVRGYSTGQFAGASGHLLTVEFRHDLDWFDTGRTEGLVFVDAGDVRFNADPWTTGPNRARVESAGIGMSWTGPAQWRASLQVAVPIGGGSASVDADDGVRAWAWVAKGF